MEYIDPSQIIQQRPVAGMGLDKYKVIEDQVHKVNVAIDADFQRTFNGFYIVRRNEDWRKVYYDLFERVKDSGDVSFPYILEELYRLTGNVEASFASKLLATLKPEMPIWDRYVVQNLNIKVPSASDPDRIRKVEELYDGMVNWYADFLKTENARECIAKFDEVLPDYAWLSDVKKIDFFLWSIR